MFYTERYTTISKEDLIENREDIIDHIKKVGNVSKIKEIMNFLLLMVGEQDKPITIEELVDETISIKKEWKKQEKLLWGNGCKYSTQAEYQRACMGSKWN